MQVEVEDKVQKIKEEARSIKGEYAYGFKDPEDYVFKSPKGLTEEIVKNISAIKEEPDWVREFRLKAYRIFKEKPMPKWGNQELLSEIRFEDIHYYIRPTDRKGDAWEKVPEYIKKTFDRLGIPEAERKFLGGVTAQYESEVVYHSLKEELAKEGIIFTDMDTAIKEYPDLVKKYFATVIPPSDNKFAALNSAVFSGGSFIYVPPGVEVPIPLQAYFRINAENVGQFERTLIIADKGSRVHYIEGCTAPIYSASSLHAAVVELIALEDAYIRYTTVQNWSHNVFNLVTKRGVAYKGATIEWVDGNIGSRLTMKYPGIYLLGEGAHGEVLSIAYAGKDQHQDTGAKIIHFAPNTTSKIVSKSISKDGGRTSYRGLIKVHKGAKNVKSTVECDALMLDIYSRSDTYPYMEIEEKEKVRITHEATVSKIDDEMLFYLNSRGIEEDEARTLVVNGFIEPFTKELPLEYAVELNRLIQLEMEGSIG